jgi:hypothetical protein
MPIFKTARIPAIATAIKKNLFKASETILAFGGSAASEIAKWLARSVSLPASGHRITRGKVPRPD